MQSVKTLSFIVPFSLLALWYLGPSFHRLNLLLIQRFNSAALCRIGVLNASLAPQDFDAVSTA